MYQIATCSRRERGTPRSGENRPQRNVIFSCAVYHRKDLHVCASHIHKNRLTLRRGAHVHKCTARLPLSMGSRRRPAETRVKGTCLSASFSMPEEAQHRKMTQLDSLTAEQQWTRPKSSHVKSTWRFVRAIIDSFSKGFCTLLFSKISEKRHTMCGGRELLA